MEERGKLQKSTQEPFSPPISNAKEPRHPAPAMARAARRRETPSAAASEPNGSQSKTQKANPFGDARRPLHHGIILLRRLCGMASPGGCRFAARQCSTTATFEVGPAHSRPHPHSSTPDSKLTWGLGIAGSRLLRGSVRITESVLSREESMTELGDCLGVEGVVDLG